MSEPAAPSPGALTLALDTGSPGVSLALGRGGISLAERQIPQEASSKSLLLELAGLLAELAAEPRDLGAILALSGPGSFTGLRVGLATALGLHQALGMPATTLSTFEALAEAAPVGRVVAAVDALRGQWFVQTFEKTGTRLAPLEEPHLVDAAALAVESPATVVGFGLGAAGLPGLEPPPLAPLALAAAARRPPIWDATRLTSPQYLRPPAVTLPSPRRS